jgi:hypothetical protein
MSLYLLAVGVLTAEKQYAALARIGLKVDSILRAGIEGEL